MICSVIATAANLLNPRKVILGGGKICCGAEASLATLMRSYERIEDLHLILLHMFVCWFKANQDKLEG